MEFKLDTYVGRSLHVLLFSDVKNTREILALMQAGTLEPEVACLNAALIPETFPLLVAAHKVLVAEAAGRLKTRTLHSELVHYYSGSKHRVISTEIVQEWNLVEMKIRESLLRCGITDSTTYVLVARFNATPEDIKAMRRLVQGTEVDISELSKRADRDIILKHFKISILELEYATLEDAMTCRIAAADAL